MHTTLQRVTIASCGAAGHRAPVFEWADNGCAIMQPYFDVRWSAQLRLLSLHQCRNLAQLMSSSHDCRSIVLRAHSAPGLRAYFAPGRHRTSAPGLRAHLHRTLQALVLLFQWHGMAWHGMAWHGMAWHGMATVRSLADVARTAFSTHTSHTCCCEDNIRIRMHTACHAPADQGRRKVDRQCCWQLAFTHLPNALLLLAAVPIALVGPSVAQTTYNVYTSVCATYR